MARKKTSSHRKKQSGGFFPAAMAAASLLPTIIGAFTGRGAARKLGPAKKKKKQIY